jgi:uncharacterized protein (DUF1330 family)
MPAYAIFIREGAIVDPEAMAAYRAPGEGHQPPQGTRPLVVYGSMEALEGELPDGIVVLEFTDMETARNWYNGPYKERAKLRQKAAPYRGFLVEGFSPPG